MCRPYRPEDRGNIAIPRPNDLGYYVTALQAFCLAAQKSIYIEHPTSEGKDLFYSNSKIIKEALREGHVECVFTLLEQWGYGARMETGNAATYWGDVEKRCLCVVRFV